MSDETGKTPETEAADDTAMQPEADAADPAAALSEENAKLKDQLLRTLAEMENLRKRTGKELRDARDYAASSFARDMLTVSDNLRRALDAVGDEARAGADAALTGLLDGVEMTEREMLKTLEKHGVKKLDPAGEKFDPNLHQAMFEVPNPQVPSGTVVQVVQSGYVIGERVLRPAMVGVAKGGPKAPKPEATEAPAEASTEAANDAGVPESGEPNEGPRPAGGPGATVDKTA
ncbi:molecular chaperone GrpE [Rhodobium orientis]|uniref:Protein GrpE n=1 Tax=Rhodobium orientis TaxID=34017 RepID=A0A327JGV6_9HYPH|nr:nucleotide exchange factor GrpE [Rhodobium orientis]MBB4305616.1 molecular chaperone GrpE [Rhodobium orientis]MBK5948727.1 nucleotide exchange factor GrpE [Rhodobium orientis]RAI24524.1 nucleotide exchange factor GrpE [Rhodobium orientis]